MNLENTILIAQGLVKLMNPLVEVVVHDLQSGKIVFIEGSLSKRKVEDPSLLEEGIDWEVEINQEAYPKIGFDGRLIKSVSIPIKESQKTNFLMCINCDLTMFDDMKNIADVFLKGMGNEQPISLFKNDYQERIHEFLHRILKEKGWKFDDLNIKKKREIAKSFFKQGAFNGKHSVEYIANLLDMGRATLFNYLKKWRNQNET